MANNRLLINDRESEEVILGPSRFRKPLRVTVFQCSDPGRNLGVIFNSVLKLDRQIMT